MEVVKMKCLKCGNCIPGEMILIQEEGTTRRAIRCAKCKDDKGTPTWVKWGTEQEARVIKAALLLRAKQEVEKARLDARTTGKRIMYDRLLKLGMEDMTRTITNVVMKFVESGKPVTRKEVGLLVWNWLKRAQ
jgi:hypothetical protein